MLCDDLIAKPEILQVLDADAMSRRINAAEKFVLERDFTAAVDAFSRTGVEKVVKVLPFCRAPFASTWIEIAYNDRTYFNEPNEALLEGRPNRIGWLVDAMDPQLSKFSMHMAWSFKPNDYPPAGIAQYLHRPELKHHYNMSCVKIEVNTADFMNYDLKDSDFHAPAWKQALANGMSPQLLKVDKALGTKDWQGELVFIVAVLAMMNTRNLMQTVEQDYEKRNVSAVKHGRRPLASHRICKLLMGKAGPKIGAGSAEERAAMRAHFVRGHLKVRKTGVYWWSPFQRGNLSLGFVTKDYKVVGGLPEPPKTP